MHRLFVKVLLLLLPVWVSAQSFPPSLRIVVTTDVHGALFPVDWFNGERLPGSLAQVHSWVKSAREAGETVILLDNGDLLQGDPAVYYSNFIEKGRINIAARVLNYMGYDAASVGNHDIETGHPVYDQLPRQFRFPYLSANTLAVDTGKPAFEPYAVLNKNGLKVAVLGLTTPKIPDWLPPVLWEGFTFADMLSTARYWVKMIQEQEQPDLLIGLFHSGVDPGYNNPEANPWMNENATRLVAERVPGFDAVFAGHDHQRHNLWVVNIAGDSVLLMDSGSRAGEMAVVTLYDQSNAACEVMKTDHRDFWLSGKHVALKEVDPDPAFIRKFAGFIDTVQQWVDQPVAELESAFDSRDAWFGPTPFVDLIHRAQIDMTGASISFAAPLSFRTILPAGTMSLGSLFRLYRYENMLYTMELTGQEILDYLNYTYSLWVLQMKSENDPMLNMTRQSNGQWRFSNAYYNFDSAAGLDYVVDLTRPAGSMVQIRSLSSGEPFETEKRYRVAMNSYRGSGGGGHLTDGAKLSRDELGGRIVAVSEQDFRFHLMEWARHNTNITGENPESTTLPVIRAELISRWSFVPAPWAHTATERESRLLRQN